MSAGEFCPKCRKYYGDALWHCKCSLASPAPPPENRDSEEERAAEWAKQFSEPKTHGPAARLVAKASALWGLRTSRAELLAEREKVRRMMVAMNEIDIVMNWNADVCCRCFTTEHPKRNPNCQYHRVEEITREALKETE